MSNKRCSSPTCKQAAGLEFSAGDTFGFRTRTSPSIQLIVDHPVVTCAGRGLAAAVPFEYCAKVHLYRTLCSATPALAAASSVVSGNTFMTKQRHLPPGSNRIDDPTNLALGLQFFPRVLVGATFFL